ncbi:hypothetical protein CDAR_409811 [Caerostris darwini]|uniref:Uncharacterized protein n=1 Tax=Caerostris darwini TaxID=1538125 RepID=A0AAV4RKE2_9ARAC|nr:hypothetical protein CDAR_409811 [Caerostris darwini]
MPKSKIFRESVYLEGGAPEWELATNAAPNGRQGTPASRKCWWTKTRADIWRLALEIKSSPESDNFLENNTGIFQSPI